MEWGLTSDLYYNCKALGNKWDSVPWITGNHCVFYCVFFYRSTNSSSRVTTLKYFPALKYGLLTITYFPFLYGMIHALCWFSKGDYSSGSNSSFSVYYFCSLLSQPFHYLVSDSTVDLSLINLLVVPHVYKIHLKSTHL